MKNISNKINTIFSLITENDEKLQILRDLAEHNEDYTKLNLGLTEWLNNVDVKVLAKIVIELGPLHDSLDILKAALNENLKKPNENTFYSKNEST
ncbi:MAG: hypothetical protein IPQ02_03965 [Saprospiraceae bacterium]|uniref:Uncharacterized protein n=1 Tax=Candidatus Defluviibacterium haderslevense TaxID=2981993 RepID=A0A9D7SBD7_9BACT|nr:hypothetical protein [Candidatus Defluviibacterium haderslevense]MBL0235778.1 hypothetical protein [Candidatus Defluviibacterium haderslevense]